MRLFQLFILVILFHPVLLPEVMAQQTIHIVPNPQEVRFESGSFMMDENIALELYLGDKNEEEFIRSQLTDEFDQSLDKKVASKANSKIVIGIPGASKKFDELLSKNKLQPNDKIGKEGYHLLVKDEIILISAHTKTGAFYGVQTLKQLIRTERNSGNIPALRINDWPDLEIRGMMDDISRGPVPTKAYMRQQVERMAEMKVNLLTYYTQDVVKTESHPAFAPPGGALDIEEWAELADYAMKFHIDLVGNFQSFGHFDQILKHPEYAHLGESETLLSPAFEESYELLEDIYSEMIPAFHSDYFHINSDETFDLGTGASKAMVDSLGKAVVYANHIKRIHKIISGMGKRIMMWGDIVIEHPEILDMLPKDIIMITWGYDIMDDYAPRILPFKKAGFQLLVSTGILNSFTTIPDFNVAKGNIGGFLAEGKKQEVWGMLNSIWDDGGFALFSRDWYGVAYAADQSWKSNPGDLTYDDRFNRAVYGATNNGLSDAILKLNELANLKSTEKMNEDILWDKIIPDKGEQVLINIQDWPEVSRIVKKAEDNLELSDPLIYKDDLKYIDHTIDLYSYMAESRPGIVQASKSYKEARKLQQENKKDARNKLVMAFKSVSEAYHELVELKTEKQYLWSQENRVYALDRVMKRYDEQIRNLKEAKDSLLSVTYGFDKGLQLPEASKIRLDIEESEGWYFQGWLMIEPIPNPNGFEDPGVDHLEDMSGIKATFPNVTEEFFFEGVKYRWRRVNTPYFAKVDLDELHDADENVVMYAFAHIDIPEDRRVRALAGSSDGIEVYVNGQSVHKNYTEREFTLDEDELYLPLKEGRNHLMIRITNESGDWAFSFRLPDSEMRSYKNRYKIIE